MRKFLTLLLLSSCTHSLCVTKCGLTAQTLPPGWSCPDMQDQESRAYKAFKATKDRRLDVCNLTRFHVQWVDARSWWSFDKMVSGITYCENGSIVIGNQAPGDSALVHELAHALQNCEPLPPQNAKEGYHANWKRDRIFEAIEAAQR